MKQLWSHRYSVASFGLSFADLYVSFVVMSNWYWGAPYDYRTGMQGGLAWFPLLLGFMSTAWRRLPWQKNTRNDLRLQQWA
jgi:hypothetical protein